MEEEEGKEEEGEEEEVEVLVGKEVVNRDDVIMTIEEAKMDGDDDLRKENEKSLSSKELSDGCDRELSKGDWLGDNSTAGACKCVYVYVCVCVCVYV